MNIFKKPLLLLVSSLFISQASIAQEGLSVYSDYLTDNYYLIHPSMAGAANCAKIRLSARQQWTDNDKSPALQTLSFNTKVGEQSGVGFIAFNDRNGYHSQFGGKVTYAHHINFSRSYYDLNQLSFGISAGVNQTTLDETSFGSTFDPLVNGGMTQKDVSFIADFGASYHYLDFYAHATVKNAIATKNDIYSDVESDNLRKYLVSAGYVFGTYNRSGYTWEPSVLLQYTEKTAEKILDVNMKMYKEFTDGQFFAGLSYRTAFDGAEYVKSTDTKKQYYHSLSPILGFKYKSIMLGYTYSHQFGDVKFQKGGFHQLTLGFNFLCRNTNYKCSCPSVNF